MGRGEKDDAEDCVKVGQVVRVWIGTKILAGA